MRGFTSKAVHGAPGKPDVHGTLRAPIYDNVTFEHPSADEMQQAFQGQRAAHSYTRISNPTIEDYEQRVRLISDALGVIAVSSGMAAISNVILALAESGTNIVTTRFLFGNSYSLFMNTLQPWGLDVRFVDFFNPVSVNDAIDENTRAVFLEAITNPQLQVADIKAIADIAHSKNVPLILDGTATTPYLFNAKAHGVDIEVISATKYISGGGTTVGGLILDYGSFNWRRNPKLAAYVPKFGAYALLSWLRSEIYRNLGACISPHNAYLQSLGLETMALRIHRGCENTLAIAQHLQSRKEVKAVNYPGLPSSPSHALARQQLPRGFGGIVTFNLGSKDECFAFMDSLRLIRRATNINDNKTLILHPASTIYVEYSPVEQEEMGISESMLRLSVGIEDLEDLLDDITQAIAAISR